jgi:hypothetical protein
MTSRWFEVLHGFAPIMCLPNRRLQFSGSTVQPAHGSVILGIGVDPERFREVFACFGKVWQ